MMESRLYRIGRVFGAKFVIKDIAWRAKNKEEIEGKRSQK